MKHHDEHGAQSHPNSPRHPESSQHSTREQTPDSVFSCCQLPAKLASGILCIAKTTVKQRSASLPHQLPTAHPYRSRKQPQIASLVASLVHSTFNLGPNES